MLKSIDSMSEQDNSNSLEAVFRDEMRKQFLAESLDGTSTPYTTVEDLREDPMLQEFLTDPQTPVEGMIGHFTGIAPNEFTLHQLYRVVDPNMYRTITGDPALKEDFLSSPLEKTIGGFWSRSLIDRIQQARANPGLSVQKNADLLARLEHLRPAILKLNDLVVSGQNPAEFNWKDYGSQSPSV